VERGFRAMANRRRGITRGSKDRGLNVWTAVLAEEFAIGSGTSSTFDIVLDTDWKPAAGTARATLMRIRGWLNVIQKITSGSFADGMISAYIALYDEDETSKPANAVNTYTDEDILWTGGHMFPFVDSGAAGSVCMIDVDVKAQRKIKNGQEVRLVVTNNLAVSVDIGLVLRGLLRRGS